MLIGFPATVAPDTWSCGLVPWVFAPASLTRAYLAPEKDSCSKVAKGPPQVVRTPILMAPAGADGAAAAVWLDEALPDLPPPQPTSASAATVPTTANFPAPRQLMDLLMGRTSSFDVRSGHPSTDNRLPINADDRDHNLTASRSPSRP